MHSWRRKFRTLAYRSPPICMKSQITGMSDVWNWLLIRVYMGSVIYYICMDVFGMKECFGQAFLKILCNGNKRRIIRCVLRKMEICVFSECAYMKEG